MSYETPTRPSGKIGISRYLCGRYNGDNCVLDDTPENRKCIRQAVKLARADKSNWTAENTTYEVWGFDHDA